MNEIQIIQQQLQTERQHFAEVAHACAAALDRGPFKAGAELAAAYAGYFAFALSRLTLHPGVPPPAAPTADASETRWREFLQAFNTAVTQHFAAIDQLRGRGSPVTEWRAASKINADTIFEERTRYLRVKAAVS